MKIESVATQAFDDQRPGTAGLRKKVQVFQQPHYLENFLQAIFDGLDNAQGGTLVIGGDGRFFNDEAIQRTAALAVGNGVKKIVVGQYGLLSTPAASLLIPAVKAFGGFVLSASHNPAGPNGDFGIKFNVSNGGQASESMTEAVYERSCQIEKYSVAEIPALDLSEIGSTDIGGVIIEVVDPVEHYAKVMSELFDFDLIRELLRSDFKMRFDAMHAVTGPYAKRIFEEILGADSGSVINGVPKTDFNGGHPDPNLKYAKHLVNELAADNGPEFGAASDGDGDRNMILGRRFFVSPGDSLAILAANAHRFPGYSDGLAGVARSMPTSRAPDAVAKTLGMEAHETPTGWRFFCNLLDAGRVTLCGEESFGTSSNHAREKDGVWAVLAWLNLLALERRPVSEVARDHWQRFGRHYYARHDYEGLSNEAADQVIAEFTAALPTLAGQQIAGETVSVADEFSYDDPVDGSRSAGQGLRILMGDQARIILRRSGTGTSGATLRLYLEWFDAENIDSTPAEMLKPLTEAADEIFGINRLTNRSAPDVIT